MNLSFNFSLHLVCRREKDQCSILLCNYKHFPLPENLILATVEDLHSSFLTQSLQVTLKSGSNPAMNEPFGLPFFFSDVKSTLIWIILYFHVYSISFSTVVFMFVACCYSVLVDCFCEGSQQCVWQWHSPPRVAGEPLGSWKSWKMVDCWVIVEWSTNDQRVFGEVGTVSWQGMETRDLTHEYSINNIFFFFFLSLKLETVILRFI